MRGPTTRSPLTHPDVSGSPRKEMDNFDAFVWLDSLYSKGGAVVNLRYFRAAPFINGAVRLQSPYPAVLSRRTLEGQGRLKTDYLLPIWERLSNLCINPPKHIPQNDSKYRHPGRQQWQRQQRSARLP